MNSHTRDERSGDTDRMAYGEGPDEIMVEYYPGLLAEMEEAEIECRERAVELELFGGYECRDVPYS
ncbi:MAG: hypothetical protein FJ118_08430 [Deltaproteobacteria bacterium]|nr:hypothetical protein [Deltaproteobacteria bacterium]